MKLRNTAATLILALLALLVLTAPSQATTTPKQVLVLGDSIVGGASNYIDFYLDHDGRVNTTVKSVGGTAICDILKGNGGPWTIDGLLAAKRYDAVVMAFSGNSLTRCMGGRTGQAIVDKYRADANQVMNVARFFGVPKVVWVKPPAAASPGLDYVRNGVGRAYVDLQVAWPAARVIDGGAGLEYSGQFIRWDHCAPWDYGRGCDPWGHIRIGADDGVHLYCSKPGGAPYGVVQPCLAYSAGSNRYGMNLAGTRAFIGL